MQYTQIVLNEPHASIEGLYDEHLSFWNIDEKFVNDIVLKWTDWHTDYLFHGYRKENIRTVRFPYSRFIVDAERLWNDPLEAEGHSEMSDIDICIGYNEDWSKPNKETIELAVNLFEDCGYKVGINEPYSNSETPECPFTYQSMMLEVNKKVYMEDGTLFLKNNLSYRRTFRDLAATLMSELSPG